MFDPSGKGLRDRLARGDCTGVVWLSLGGAALAEIAARAGADALVLDLQHGLFDRRDLESVIGAVPLPVLIRVAENGAAAISQALDAGADGVIVPLVESQQEAAAAVGAARYPPHGRRSAGGVRPLGNFPAYRAGVAAQTVVIVMIETHQGVENAAAIAATPGLDMVFIGTGDLAMSLGVAPGDPVLDTAISKIEEACAAARMPCGIFTGTTADAVARRGQGFGLVVQANDLSVVAEGFAAAAERFGAGRADPVTAAQ